MHKSAKWWALLALGVMVAGGGAFVIQQDNGKAQPAQNIAKSQIIKVTVYPNSAVVTREVEVPVGAGLTELVVSPLPERVVDSSLYSEGTDGLRVLTTRYRTRQVKEASREDVRKTNDEIKKLQLAAEKLQGEIGSLEENIKMIGKLEGFTSVTTVDATKKGSLDSETVIKLSKYVMEERMEKAKKLVDLKQSLKSNQEQVDFLNRKLQEMSAGTSKTERDAVIVVDRVKGQGGKIRLNYLVDAVSWRPQYKIRAGNKVDEPVEIDYQASLVQQSGEDWNGVHLTLSTAQPMLNAVPPNFEKLEVTVVARSDVGMPPGGAPGASAQPFSPQDPGQLQQEAKELRMQAELYSQKKDVTKNYKALNEAAAKEQAWELMQSGAELKAAKLTAMLNAASTVGPSVTYHLPHMLSVPSRNDEQVIEVTKVSLTPRYYYKTIPVLNNFVYRLADLENKSEHVLLAGEATMYQGTDFVGRMTMPLVAIGKQFTVGFGVDPQLQVNRRLMDKTKAKQGGNQVLTYTYRILVNSYKKTPVDLQVWDRLPYAENELANVTLVKTTPDLSDDPDYRRDNKDFNLLRWDLKIEPMMKGEKAAMIEYEFKLELDREMVISKVLSK